MQLVPYAKQLQLSNNNGFVLVPYWWHGFLMAWKWYPSSGYAISSNGRYKIHRIITNASPGQLVDHVDRNKLNCLPHNLRIASKEQNVHNQKKREGTKNKFKGVNYVKRLDLWQSRCRMNYGDYFLGYYKTELAAAIAYNVKARELSEYILLNEINLPEEECSRLLVEDRVLLQRAEKTSKHKGIYWHKRTGRAKSGVWEVKLLVDGCYKYFGRYINEHDAIKALQKAKASVKIETPILF